MAIRAVYYDATTGEIVQIIPFDDETDPADIDALAPAGSIWVDDADADADLHYFDTSATPDLRTDRPVLLDDDDGTVYVANDGVDGVMIASVPSGTILSFEDDLDHVFSGSEDFSFITEIWGEWIYAFDPPFPWRPLRLTIISNAGNTP